ncbi:MAG: hypothetical protein ACTSPY_14680 [Candidatus Helarchaeota archaeon]
MGKLRNKKRLIIRFCILIIIIIGMLLLTAPFHIDLLLRGYPGTELNPWGDAWHYYSMSINPFNSNVEKPFCFRILTPLIVYILPLDQLTGFWILTIICTGLTSFLFYNYLKEMSFKHFYSLLGTIFFTLSISNFYLFYYTIFVEPMQYLLFLTGCYIILLISKGKISGSKEIILVSLIISIGVFNKENILFLIPLYLISTKGYKGYKIVKTIIVSIPPLIFYVFLRSFIPNSGTTYEGLWIIYHLNHWTTSGFAIIVTFLLIWILIIPGIYKSNLINDKKSSFLKYSSLIIPFFIFQMALASDIYRNVFLGFPIIIPIGLSTITNLEDTFLNFPLNSSKKNESHLISYIILFFQMAIPVFYFLQWDIPITLNLEFLRPFYFGLILIGYIFIIFLIIRFLYIKKRG